MVLEIYGEIEPSRSKKELKERARKIALLYNRVDIPDVPLGKPNISAPILGMYLHARYGTDVIAHLRVIDHNIVSLKSIIKTMSYFGLKKAVFLRGDLPQQGDVCEGHWQPEDAVSYARKYEVDAGLLVSLGKPLEVLSKRLDSGASSLYATRYDGLENSFKKLIFIKEKSNVKLGVYLTVMTKRNSIFLNNINSKYILYKNIIKEIEKLENIVDRIIISAPGDGWAVLRIGLQLFELGLLGDINDE